MEKYEYKEILSDAGLALCEYEKNKLKPLLRQCLICSGVWVVYFIQGLYLGLPTILIVQTRREANSTDAVTDEMASWLSSLPLVGAVPSVVLLPSLWNQKGPKFCYTLICLLTIIGYIVLYNSTNLYYVLVSQLFFSVCTAGMNTVFPVLIVEYTSPKYRGIFLTLKSACTFWGIWVSNAIGTFFYWKNIAILGLACSAFLITTFVWPESPYWLAKEGRYAECAKSHRWLKGVNENSEKELAKLIRSFKTYNEMLPLYNTIDIHRCCAYLSSFWTTIICPGFYKPALVCIMIYAQYHFSGKFAISIYAIQVFKTLSQDEAFAFKLMLTLDGVTVSSMYVGCILARYCKRRTLMLSFSITGVIFLYLMSLYLYLVSLAVLQENHIVTLFLLTVYSIAIGCGPMILITSISGELAPLRFKYQFMAICGLFKIMTGATLIKILPFMIRALTIHGYFLFYAIPSTFLIIAVYIYLPETKDKTLIEIEEYFNGRKSLIDQSNSLFTRK